jgi:ATP-dependent helicase YprA (DUF1998 family)
MSETLATRAGHATVSWLGFANVPLRRYLLDTFNQPYGDTGSFLANPCFEAVFGWRTATKTMSQLSSELLHPLVVSSMDSPDPELKAEYRFPADRYLYSHQLTSWQLLSGEVKNSVVVASGTGSGKTECFLVPILDSLVREQLTIGGPLIGVRALLLPTAEAMVGSEIRDRKTLRKTPPPILVTNATMLEYMLVRTQDLPILETSQGKLQWIILDEAHTYIGSQAAELALLIRRVLHAFGVKPK